MKMYKWYVYVIMVCMSTMCFSDGCLAGALSKNNSPANTVCSSKIPFYTPKNGYKFPTENLGTKPQKYKVERIIDGDTLRYFDNGKSVSVRFLNIDCDETKDNYRIYKQAYLTERKIECVMKNGQAAKEHLQKIVDEKPQGYVEISFKSGLDKYGRRLGVVYKNGINVNEELVKSGFCANYEYKK